MSQSTRRGKRQRDPPTLTVDLQNDEMSHASHDSVDDDDPLLSLLTLEEEQNQLNHGTETEAEENGSNHTSDEGADDPNAEQEHTEKASIAPADTYFPNNLVFFSIDLEHGGDFAGILQLSAEAFVVDSSGRTGKRLDLFNEFVKPPSGCIFIPDSLSDKHGLTLQTQELQSAKLLPQVWGRFVTFVESLLANGKKGVMVAWGGKACDCEWLFRVTELRAWNCNGSLRMPTGLDYFMDPGKVI